MYRQAISLKKSLLLFIAAKTYSLRAHSLEIIFCLFVQQEIRETRGNHGGKDLYLIKHFIVKAKKNIFIKQFLKQL